MESKLNLRFSPFSIHTNTLVRSENPKRSLKNLREKNGLVFLILLIAALLFSDHANAQDVPQSIAVRAIKSDPSLKTKDSVVFLKDLDPQAKFNGKQLSSKQSPQSSEKVKALPKDGNSILMKSSDSRTTIYLEGYDPSFKQKQRSTSSYKQKRGLVKDGPVRANPPSSADKSPKRAVRHLDGSSNLRPERNTNSQALSLSVAMNNTPVAVPDVYTTPQGEPLVVASPGHLANDLDADGDQLSWISYTVPVNGTVTGAMNDGGFTYTPDAGFTGIETIPVTITDGNGNIATGLVIILVEENLGPEAVPDVYVTQQGEPLVVSAPGHVANDTDPEGDALSWISYTVPDNGSVTGAMNDGTFTYTPNPGFTGIETIPVTITDGNGNIATGLVIILVRQNYAPTAVPDVYTTQQGQPLVVSAPGHVGNDTDPEGDTLTWISYTVPTNGTVTGAMNDGTFTYTPNAGFFGIESIPVTITDGNGNIATGIVTILVEENNFELIAVPDVYTTPQGEPLVVASPGHLANDLDADGDQLSWISYTVPVNGTVSGAMNDGGFTYTPNAGFTGIESIPVTITDGNGNISTGLVLILVEENLGPEAVPDVYVTQQGEPLVVSAPGHVANDTDPEGDALSWISYTVPDNGSVTGAMNDGTFTYTPNPGFTGIETIPVTITDGNGNLATGLVVILVRQNYAPTAVPDVYTTQQGQPLVVSAPGHVGNDTDPEGDPLSWISYTVPTNGTVTGAMNDGSFTYTPNAGFFGIESIPVTITDGNGNISTGLLAILVFGNLPPIAEAGEDQTVFVGQVVSLNGSGSNDPNGDALTFSWTFDSEDASDPLPPGSTAVLTDPDTATPSFIADIAGTYSLRLIVNDGLEDSSPDFVLIEALTIKKALKELLNTIAALREDGTLRKGQAFSLSKKVWRASFWLKIGKKRKAIKVLKSLRNQIVKLWKKKGVLNEEQAQDLLDQVDAIIDAIGNPSSGLLFKTNASPLAKNESSQLSIYPNPVRNTANLALELPFDGKVNVNVFDLYGRQVTTLKTASFSSGEHIIPIDVTDLKDGIYFVRIQGEGGIEFVKRIVINK